ncbi:MAG: ABC transporter substrate-binding protein [Acidilobaceae archaeon]
MKARLAMLILALLVIAFILLFIVLEFREDSVTSEYPKEAISLRVGLLPIIDAIPFIVAEYEDLYAKYGLNVSIVMYGSARDRDAAFMAGLIDVALNDPITTLILADRGVNVRIISLLLGEYPEDGLFYLLAPPGSTISVPRSIAISRNTIIEFAAWHIVEGLNIDPKSVEWIDVPSIPVRFQMLLEGRVEAAVLPDPWGTLAITKGARLIADDRILGVSITISIIIARGDIADIGVMMRLRDALNEALSLYKANPEKYRSIIEEKIYIPEELRGRWLPEWRGSIVDYPRDNFELVKSWLLERALISKPLRYEDLVLVSSR